MRVRSAVALAAAIVAVLLAADAAPVRQLAEHNRPFQAAFETSAAVIALLAAYLVSGRFAQRRSLTDLLLAAGFGVIAATNLLLLAVPSMGGGFQGGPSRWAAVITSLVGKTLIAAAALLPAGVVYRPRRTVVRTVALVGAVFVATYTAVELLGDWLPVVVRSTSQAGGVHITVHPLVTAAELVGAALYAIAAIGFFDRSRRRDDHLMPWLAGAMLLAALARANYVIVPSLYTDYVYVGDVFRLGFYLVLLVGAFHEIRGYWAGMADAAVLEERRRMARDLHDGMAQELAFMTTQLRRLNRTGGASPTIARLGGAAERALNESRRAIAALTRPLDESLEVTLAQAAEEIAERYGATLHLDLPAGMPIVRPAQREALVRVVQEAINNAGRDGHASVIRLSLTNGDGIHVVVSDDGTGFDPAAVPLDGSHFGLVSMRERIEALGGCFELSSAPGAGTRVEVHLP